MPWNPPLYHKFQDERFAPFEDLLKLIEKRPGLRVVDLGCGTGELTRRLADFLPDSRVWGIDSSDEMLAKTQSVVREGLSFELGSIESVSGKWDLVFSHAAIHWVDDHVKLIPALFSLLDERGQLAVQLPSNHNHPSHMVMREIAGDEPFRSAVGGWTRISPVLDVAQYAELLYQAGAVNVTAFEKVYPHVLADVGEMVSWMSGTALIPYLERIPAELHDEFLSRYQTRLTEIFPSRPVFFGFKRILFSARKPGAPV